MKSGLTRQFTPDDLRNWKSQHQRLVAVDSDGCVFDTVALKQRLCFHPLIVTYWNLAPLETQVRETAEYVNLFSPWRGQNRFLNLLRTFDLLAGRADVRARGIALPDPIALRRFVESGVPLGHPALEESIGATHDHELVRLLAWSQAVDAAVAHLGTLTPFQDVVSSLECIRKHADIVCVSQTPAATVEREWIASGLIEYADGVAGPELGTKAHHLKALTAAGYAPGCVLMIGDAPGDMEAAERAGALFYPINPGGEAAAWRCFKEQAWDRFLRGTFTGPFADGLRARFVASLSHQPPWAMALGM